MADTMWMDAFNEQPAEEASPTGYLEQVYQPTVAPSGAVAAFHAGQAAAIRGEPTSAEQIAKASYESSMGDPRDFAEIEYYEGKRTELAQFISDAINSTDPNSAVPIEEQVTGTTNLLARQGSPASKELAYAESVAPNAAPDTQEQLAFRLMAANDIAQLVEGTGVLDKISDFGGMLIPGGYTKDVYDVPEAVSGTKGLEEIADEDLHNIINKFHALSPQRKAVLWPLLRNAVMDATSTFGITDGNALKAAGILNTMLEPSGASNLTYEAKAYLAFDVATMVPIGKVATGAKALATAGSMKAAKGVLTEAVTSTWRNTNAVKLAAEAGDKSSAVLINSAALGDDTVAAGANMSRTTAALNAFPVQTAEWLKEVTPGLPDRAAVQLNDDVSRAAGFVRSMTSEGDLMHIGALDASDRAYQIESFMSKMERRGEDFAQEGYALGDLRIISEDASGFTWGYKLNRVSPADAKPRYKWDYTTNQPIEIKQPEPVLFKEGTEKWSIDAVTGTYSATATDVASHGGSTLGLTADTWAIGGELADFGKAITDMGLVSDLSDAVRFKMTKFLEYSMEPIKGPTNVAARARVDAVLMHGDEFINPNTQIKGRVFTKQELAAGFDIGGKRVSLTRPEEVQAYYRMRMYFDATHRLQEDVLRSELDLGGFKQTRFSLRPELIGREAGEPLSYEVVAKPYATKQAASMSVSKRPGYRALDIATGRNELIDSALIESQYAKGNVLVRTKRDFSPHGEFAIGKEHVEYIFVPKDSIGELPGPGQLLNYKPGYIPKITQVQYVVKSTLPIIKAGNPNASKTTATRAFNSLKHAEQFRMELAQKFSEKHGVPIDTALERFPISNVEQLSPAERLEDAVGAHGGLYTGTRSADDLLFGFAGTLPERVSALDTAKRYLGHLSTQFPRNDLRLGLEKRWLNTVKAKLPDVKLAGFDRTALPDTPMGKALGQMRRHIREWNGIPTEQETLFQAAVQYTNDWLLTGYNKVGGRLGLASAETSPGLFLKSLDPIRAVKAATTHLALGCFNIAQIPVQAGAAMIALSRRYGTSLTRNTASDIMHAFHFAYLDNIRNETVLGKLLGKMVDSGTMSPVVADAYRAWTRTGLYESSLGTLEGGIMSTGGMGVTMDSLKMAGEAGLTPWKIGDLFGRRVSFIKEYAYYAAKHPGEVIGDEALEVITKETQKDLLQLNQAFRAVWQGGKGTGTMREIAGMMTQYMQVPFHMMELLGKSEARGGFSKADTFKVLAGQVMFFGAAGVPILSMLGPTLLRAAGVTTSDTKTATAVNQGLVGALFSTAFGMHADVSQRFAIGAQLNDFVKEMLTSDDPIVLRALGPAGSLTGSRTFDAIKELSILFTGSREGDQEFTWDEAKMALATIAQIPSSGRNLYKAYMMSRASEVIDRHGNAIMRKKFSLAEEMAQIFGMRLTRETNARFQAMDAKTIEQVVTEAADHRVKLMYDALFVHKLGEAPMANITRSIQIMDEGLQPYIREKVQQRVRTKLWENPDTLEDKAINHFLNTTVPERLGMEAVYDAQGIDGMTNPIVVPFAQILSDAEREEEK